MWIEPAPTAEEAAAIAAALAQLSTDLKVRGYRSKWGRPGLKPRHYMKLGDWRKTARREAVETGV
jgi:hypothetical protein